MTEEQRLRSVLVDIAAGGGWQGRFAQEVLDTIQAEQDAEPEAIWYIDPKSGRRIETTRVQAYQLEAQRLTDVTNELAEQQAAACNINLPPAMAPADVAAFVRRFREETRRVGVDLGRLGELES